MKVEEYSENYKLGWIKLYRSFTKWEWYDDIHMSRLFLHLLLSATHKGFKWHGKEIEPGQVVTSIRKLAKETKLSIQQTRTCLTRLKSTQEITQVPTHHFSLITICNYVTYQNEDSDSNTKTTHQSTFNQHTPNTPYNKNVKNVKNKKGGKRTFEQRKKEFIDDIARFKDKYPKDLLNNFFVYWSEKVSNQNKMRFELQDTWQTGNRLYTWKQKEEKFNPSEKEEKIIPTFKTIPND